MPKTLSTLRPGERAVTTRIGGEGALHRRLMDMGFTPGVRVLLERAAPGGDPLQVRLRGYSRSLRREEAAQITVREE